MLSRLVTTTLARAALMWIGVTAMATQATAHQVTPPFLKLRPGGMDYINVADAGTCEARIQAQSMNPSAVSIYAIDMDTGEMLPGDGVFAAVDNRVDQVFIVEAVDMTLPFPMTAEIKICWTGVNVPPGPSGPCTEDNCGEFPGGGVSVFVELAPDPLTVGARPSDAPVRDPINTKNGELFTIPDHLFALGGPMPLDFLIHYASMLVRDGVSGSMGRNWLHSYEWEMVPTGNNLEIRTPTGRVMRFEKGFLDSAWSLTPYTDAPFELVESGDEYVLGDLRTQRMYTFDAGYRLIRIEDGRGNAHTLTYTGSDLTQISDGLGRTLTLTYSGGRLADVSDGTRTHQFTYDGFGRLETMTDPAGGITSFAYDPAVVTAARLVSRTYPLGNVLYTQTYDSGSRVVSQADGFGNTYTLSFDTSDSTTVFDPVGNTMAHKYGSEFGLTSFRDEAGFTAGPFEYDAEGRRTQVTDRLGGTTGWTYHSPSGLLETETAADGALTTHQYTARVVNGITFYDRTLTIRADGTTESYAYDAAGNLTAYTDPAGKTATFTYNSRGQILTRTNRAGGLTTHTYNADGTVATTTDPAGNVTGFAYDALRRPIAITLPDGSTLTYAYDALDRILSVVDEKGNTHVYNWDANGNLTSLVSPLGNTWSYGYDAMDRLLSTTDPLGNVTTASYDPLERPASITDPNGNVLTLDYDATGRLNSIIDAGGHSWTRTHGAEGVMASATNPHSETTSFTSDIMGRITLRTSPIGNATSRTYDILGRAVEITDPVGRTTSFPRDDRGLPVSMDLPIAGTAYTRNDLGQVIAVTDPRGNVWNFDYDNRGFRISETDPLGNVTGYQYDDRSRISTVTFPGGLGTVALSYDGAGLLTDRVYSDGTALQYQYDSDDRLLSAAYTGPGPAAPGPGVDKSGPRTEGSATFAYNARGDIIACNGLGMAYDAAGRLLEVTLGPGRTVTYGYDARNLLTSVTDWVNGSTTMTYDDAGRLTSVTRPNNTVTTYTYDADGRVQSLVEEGLSTIQLTRDAAGRITSASRDVPLAQDPAFGGITATYDPANHRTSGTHDALGRVTAYGARTLTWDLHSRVMEIDDGSPTTFTPDGLGNLVSRDDGAAPRTFVWNYGLTLPSVSVCRDSTAADLFYYVHTPDGHLMHSVDASNNRRFYHFDEMGNTLFLTGDGGQITDSYCYTPYGVEIASTGATENPFRWQGRYGVIREGDLYIMRARLYDPEHGRFLSRDPVEAIDPQGINPYQAFHGNPLRFIDPLGTNSETADEEESGFWWFLKQLRDRLFGDGEAEKKEAEEERKRKYHRLVEKLREQEEARQPAKEGEPAEGAAAEAAKEPAKEPAKESVHPGSGCRCAVMGPERCVHVGFDPSCGCFACYLERESRGWPVTPDRPLDLKDLMVPRKHDPDERLEKIQLERVQPVLPHDPSHFRGTSFLREGQFKAEPERELPFRGRPISYREAPRKLFPVLPVDTMELRKMLMRMREKELLR